MYRPFCYLLLAVGLVSGARPAAAGEYIIDWERLHAAGQSAWEAWAPPEWQAEYTWLSLAEWRGFEARLLRALQHSDWQPLADLWPEAQGILEVLTRMPAAAPYADWLARQMDYMRIAHDVRVPARPAPPPPGIPAVPSPAPPPEVPVPERSVDLARETERWQQELAGRAAPARAGEWAPQLKDIFEAEGVPGHWIWLAEVESSFNPQARSPVGATGLFQFMPATAERFGLRLTPADERLDPWKSAQAAAQYLQLLYQRFGSWPLALAAYNAGEGRVGRALRTHGGTQFDDIALHLPTETQMYVPRIIATVILREGYHPLTR